MKILLVNHFPLEGSGSGVYTKNIAMQLLNMGHQVRVIVVDIEKHNNYNFPVHTIFYYKFPCFTTHPKSNNKFYNLSRQEMNDYLKKFISAISDEVRNFKPDLIHCQHLWVAPYAALQCNVPYIITAHGTDIKGYKKDKRYRHIALKAALNAKKIVTISKQVNSDVKKYYYLDDDRLKLILNGFDEKIFYPRNLDKNKILKQIIPGLNRKPKNIISFVGKLTSFKGVDILIKAAKIYENQLPDVITLITGDGELRDRLELMVNKLKLNSVHFIGNMPQQRVANIYNIADISVVPSRVEPFGLVALEALACGTPVVASRAGGLTDFINEEVGRLFEMNNYHQLAQKIIESINNNDKEKKGEYAAQYAINKFSWNHVIKELIEVYEDAVKII